MILLKRSKIEQTDAINQIAIVNSDNTDITILNNPIDGIQYLIRKGKLKDAADLAVETIKKAKQMHPLYPQYSYKTMEIGSDILFTHEPANKEIAKLYPLHYKGRLQIIDSDVVNHNIDEFLLKKYFMQEKIKINIEYLEAWIGEKLVDDLGEHSFEQYAVKKAKWYMAPRKLPDPLKTKLLITTNSEHNIIDYLELNITSIVKSKNEIEISNIHQLQSPVVLSITMTLKENGEICSKSKAKLNFKVRKKFEGSIIAEKIFLEFMKFSSEHSQIELVNLCTNDVIFASSDFLFDDPHNIEYIDEKIAILNDLLEIEKKLKISFIIPNQMKLDDFEKIEVLKSLINQEKVLSNLSELSVLVNEREFLSKLINEIKNDPLQIKFKEKIEIELFNVKLDKVVCFYEINDVKVQNIDKLKQKFKYYDDGENIKVNFESTVKNNVKVNYYIE